MTPNDNSVNYISKAFLENAYKQLNEFKNSSYDNILKLTQDFYKIEKAFKCSLLTGNNKACEGLIELYDEVIKKTPDYELQNINIRQFRDIMVLVGRGLKNEKCVNTSLLSYNEKFLTPSVIAQVKAIKNCQNQNIKNPFVFKEDKIIDNFNQTLNNISCIYPPTKYFPLLSLTLLDEQDEIDENEVELITLKESSFYNIS